MSKIRVGLLYGGRSVEHEVSIVSATSIRKALDPKRFEILPIGVDHDGRFHLGNSTASLQEGLKGPEVWIHPAPSAPTLFCPSDGRQFDLDVFFPIIHGTGGEDGILQGLLELSGIPYVGSGVASSAIQMDKDFTKRLLEKGGIPVVPWITVTRHEIVSHQIQSMNLDARVEQELGLPVFVKPASLGSSVGISKVKSCAELHAALQLAAKFDTKILIERGIDAREIEVAVLGNDAPQASIPGEIRPKSEFYDYAAKYQDDTTELLVPAPLTPSKIDNVQQLALHAFKLLDASGFARVDFFLDRKTGQFFLNEINSLPGFTPVSMFPRLWEASGLAYPALLEKLIALAFDKNVERKNLARNYFV